MRLLITGTDTEVGKSIVTAALASAIDGATAIKPLATGGPFPGEDATLIAAAAGHAPRTFLCAPQPASPARALQEAGMALRWPVLLEWITAHPAPLLVEGVGGWEVPIGAGRRVSDLAAALGYPVLLVAANRLGVLNHTLLTAAAIAARGLTLAGVVLNGLPGGADEPLASWNLADLQDALDVPVVPLPAVPLPGGLAAAGAVLREALLL